MTGSTTSFTGQTPGRPALKWPIWMGRTEKCCCGRIWRSPEPLHCTPSRGTSRHPHTLHNSPQMLSNPHTFIYAYPLWTCPSCSAAAAEQRLKSGSTALPTGEHLCGTSISQKEQQLTASSCLVSCCSVAGESFLKGPIEI